MESSEKYARYEKEEHASEIDEARMQGLYIQFLSDKDQNWWQDKIKEMHTIIAKDSNSPVSLQTQRLLSFLSLAVYMGANHSISSTDDAATAHFLTLYGLVDPTNPEHSYMFAELYARESNPDKAMSSLHDAVRLGFTDVRRMAADSNFNSLRQQPAYKKIVNKLKTAPAKIDMTQ
jgi:hypothetical protein